MEVKRSSSRSLVAVAVWLALASAASCATGPAHAPADAAVMPADAGSGGSSGAGGSGGSGGRAADAGGAAGSDDAGAATDTGAVSDAAPLPDGPALPPGVTGLFPAPGAAAVCADAPLRLTFSAPVTVGTAGKLQLFAAARPDTPADTIDVAASSFTDRIGGRQFFTNRPIFINGNEAVVHLHGHAMSAGQSYFVTVDAGVFVGADRRPLPAITGNATWRFTTAAAPASAAAAALSVAADGSAPYCTVQGAIDAVPAGNDTPVTITIGSGTYNEIVFISQKNKLTLRGQDRKKTIIAYANNETLQQQQGPKFRALVGVEVSNQLVIENLTLHNLTPQGGSQAEALRVEPGDQVILRDADFLSLQDTLLLSGRVYVTGSYVEGNVDFIWGTGTAYFDHCELKTVGVRGYNVQARNPADRYGYTFVDCKLTGDANVAGQMLARIDVTSGTGYPASHVAYVDCAMDRHIDPKGWLVTPAGGSTGALRFWEYHSTDLTGARLDVSKRDPASRQLTDAQAAMMRDKSVVLAGWNPTP